MNQTAESKTLLITVSFLTLLALVFVASSFSRNRAWRDPYSLWENTASRSAMKPRPYTYLALAYARDGRLDDAARYFAKATSLGAQTVETSCNQGVLFLKMQQFKRSVAEFTNCLEHDPDSFTGYLGLTDALNEAGQATEALNRLLAALKHPSFQTQERQSQIMFKIGSLYAHNGRLDKAESYLTRAIELDPQNPYAVNALGNVYLMNGWLREASNQYVRAIELKPDEPEPIYNAAITFDRLGRHDKALEYYRKFIELSPEGYDEALANARAAAGVR